MGQSSVSTAPTLRAARSSSGCASHTSSLERRPFLNSLTTALRASRYSTRPPVPETGNPCKADGPNVIVTRVPSAPPESLVNAVVPRVLFLEPAPPHLTVTGSTRSRRRHRG